MAYVLSGLVRSILFIRFHARDKNVGSLIEFTQQARDAFGLLGFVI
jgi:hypothetical protein